MPPIVEGIAVADRNGVGLQLKPTVVRTQHRQAVLRLSARDRGHAFLARRPKPETGTAVDEAVAPHDVANANDVTGAPPRKAAARAPRR